MTFEEWWERNSEEISADCEIALTETIKSWFRQVYAQGMMRGEKYLKDKIRPHLDKMGKLIQEAMKPREPVPEEVEAEAQKRRTQTNEPPVQVYKEGDKVQVFIHKLQQWIDGTVVVRDFSSTRDKEVLVEFKRLDGGTDDQGSDVERRNFLFTQIRKIW